MTFPALNFRESCQFFQNRASVRRNSVNAFHLTACQSTDPSSVIECVFPSLNHFLISCLLPILVLFTSEIDSAVDKYSLFKPTKLYRNFLWSSKSFQKCKIYQTQFKVMMDKSPRPFPYHAVMSYTIHVCSTGYYRIVALECIYMGLFYITASLRSLYPIPFKR